jgi:hypothetical protein
MFRTWYRAVTSPEQALRDLERGYSYHQLEEYTDEQVEEMDENGELEQLPNGEWVVPLAGLCGFSTSNRMKGFLRTSGFGPFIAIYEGDYVGEVYDGELFKPRKLLRVVHKSKFDE